MSSSVQTSRLRRVEKPPAHRYYDCGSSEPAPRRSGRYTQDSYHESKPNICPSPEPGSEDSYPEDDLDAATAALQKLRFQSRSPTSTSQALRGPSVCKREHSRPTTPYNRPRARSSASVVVGIDGAYVQPRVNKLPESVLATGLCPFPACHMRTRPGVDLERHYLSHFPINKGTDSLWICNGVHIKHAAAYNVTITDKTVLWDSSVEPRVGKFCGMVFNRKDSLEKHLKNPNIKCVCDMYPPDWYLETKPL